MKPTLLLSLIPMLMLSLLLSAGCKKDKEAEDGVGEQSNADEDGDEPSDGGPEGGSPEGGSPEGGGPGGGGPGGGGPGGGGPGGGGPGGGGPGGGGPGGGGPGGGGAGGGFPGGPGGGARPGGGFPGGGSSVQIDPSKPYAPQVNWSVGTQRLQPPNQDIRAIYNGKPHTVIIRAFGNPQNTQAAGNNGLWTYSGMKIRDAQGKTYNAVRFTIQPVAGVGGGKVIGVEAIPGAIAGGGGQNSGEGQPGGAGGGFPGGPGGGRGGPGGGGPSAP